MKPIAVITTNNTDKLLSLHINDGSIEAKIFKYKYVINKKGGLNNPPFLSYK